MNMDLESVIYCPWRGEQTAIKDGGETMGDAKAVIKGMAEKEIF